MTHDELLVKLDDYGFGVPPLNALRAVVELHKPYKNDSISSFCQGCELIMPCPTIQAIERELK